MKSLRSLCLLPFLIQPFVSHAYNETGEALTGEAIYRDYSAPNDSAHWWANFGLGVGSTFSTDRTSELNGKFSGQFSFNGLVSPHTFLTFYNNGLSASNDSRVYDTGVMYGYIKRKPNWYASASAGLCYTHVKISAGWEGYYWHSRTAYESGSAGIPLQVQTFWTPFRHFGIGVIGHGVVSKNSYVNALLAIQFYA